MQREPQFMDAPTTGRQRSLQERGGHHAPPGNAGGWGGRQAKRAVQSRNAAEELLRLATQGGGGGHEHLSRAATFDSRGHDREMQLAKYAQTLSIQVSIDEKKRVLSSGGDTFITPAPEGDLGAMAAKPAPRLLTQVNTERNALNIQAQETPGSLAAASRAEPLDMDEAESNDDTRPRSIMRRKTKEQMQRSGRLSFQELALDEEELCDYCDVVSDAPAAQPELSLVQRLARATEQGAKQRASPSAESHVQELSRKAPALAQRSAPSTLSAAPVKASSPSASISPEQIAGALPPAPHNGPAAASGEKPPPYILNLQEQERRTPLSSPDPFLNPLRFKMPEFAPAVQPDLIEAGWGSVLHHNTSADPPPARANEQRSVAQVMRAFLGLPSNFVHKPHLQVGAEGRSGDGGLIVETQRITYVASMEKGNVVRKSVPTKVMVYPDSYGRHDRNFDSLLASDLQWPVQRDAGGRGGSGAVIFGERLTVMLLGTTQDLSSFQVHADLCSLALGQLYAHLLNRDVDVSFKPVFAHRRAYEILDMKPSVLIVAQDGDDRAAALNWTDKDTAVDEARWFAFQSFVYARSSGTVFFVSRRTLPDGSWTDAVVLNKDKDPHFREALAAWRAIVAGRYGSVLNMSAKDLWSLEVNQLLFRLDALGLFGSHVGAIGKDGAREHTRGEKSHVGGEEFSDKRDKGKSWSSSLSTPECAEEGESKMLEDSIPLVSCAAGSNHQSTNMFVHKSASLASFPMASSPASHASLNGMPPSLVDNAGSNGAVFALDPRSVEALTPGPERRTSRALGTSMEPAIFPTPPQTKLHADAMEAPTSSRASVVSGENHVGHRNGTVPGGAGSEDSILVEARIEAKLDDWPGLMLPSRRADSLLAVKGQAVGRVEYGRSSSSAMDDACMPAARASNPSEDALPRANFELAQMRHSQLPTTLQLAKVDDLVKNLNDRQQSILDRLEAKKAQMRERGQSLSRSMSGSVS